MTRDYTRQEVLDIIEREAQGRGIPRSDFLRFAYIETGGAFDERASRGAHGAKGLFQFVPTTAETYGIAGRELDPVANTDAAARLYLDNRRDIAAAHARSGHPFLSGKPEPDGLDMYMAHQQGAAGYRSIQAALADGAFTRADTRPHLLNNISPRDIQQLTGVSYGQFSQQSDQQMARTFVNYWDTKFDRIRIPEKGIGPARPASQSEGTPPSHSSSHVVERANSRPTERQSTHAPTSATARSANADGELIAGEHGRDVTRLQRSLNRLGYTDAHGHALKEDGLFGRNTVEAVKAFQRAHALDADGVAGAKTQGALTKADAGLLTNPAHPHHAYYEQMLHRVHEAESRNGVRAGAHSERLASALVVEGLREGLQRVDRVEFNDTGTLARAVQVATARDEPVLNRSTDAISTQQAMRQSVAESSQQAHQVAVNVRAQQEDRQRKHAVAPAM